RGLGVLPPERQGMPVTTTRNLSLLIWTGAFAVAGCGFGESSEDAALGAGGSAVSSTSTPTTAGGGGMANGPGGSSVEASAAATGTGGEGGALGAKQTPGTIQCGNDVCDLKTESCCPNGSSSICVAIGNSCGQTTGVDMGVVTMDS